MRDRGFSAVSPAPLMTSRHVDTTLPFLKMKIIQHDREVLHKALVSTSPELTSLYLQYTGAERRLLEEAAEHPGSLFHCITVHSESDWIPAHPEPPQDFESFYTDASRRTPSADHQTIYIQTIGCFGEDTEQCVQWLRGYCQAFFYGLTVKLLPTVTVAETRCSFRINSSSHNLQILTGDLLRFLGNRKPKDAFCIVGITMIDLYPKDSWNFVFGQASLSSGMGVLSFARYDDNFYSRSYAGRLRKQQKLQKDDYSVLDGFYTPPISSSLLLRSCKTMTHEIAHMFGIKHCQWLSCVMQGSNHLEESDRRPLDFCPVCLRKLQVAIGFKMADRYKALLQWMEEEQRKTSRTEGAACGRGPDLLKPTQDFHSSKVWLHRCLSVLQSDSC